MHLPYNVRAYSLGSRSSFLASICCGRMASLSLCFSRACFSNSSAIRVLMRASNAISPAAPRGPPMSTKPLSPATSSVASHQPKRSVLQCDALKRRPVLVRTPQHVKRSTTDTSHHAGRRAKHRRANEQIRSVCGWDDCSLLIAQTHINDLTGDEHLIRQRLVRLRKRLA